jgi:hypothetical protein
MTERRIAILIANSQFSKEPKLENLQYPENDAEGLAKVLSSQAYGQFHEVICLKNRTNLDILTKLNSVWISYWQFAAV